jgi:hypothetical protein
MPLSSGRNVTRGEQKDGAGCESLRAVAPVLSAFQAVVGFLHSRSVNPNVALVSAFRKGLSEAGFMEG